MRLTYRETVLLIATVFAVLFGGFAILAKPKFERLKELRDMRSELKWQIERDRQFVAKEPALVKKYEALSKLLPPAVEENMGVRWQQILERVARKNNVRIINSKAGIEKKLGDVYELPIDCKDWEGSLEGIVHFLFDLQNEGAMLDIRRLMIKPKGGQVLRGNFALYCAYTREPTMQETGGE